MKQKCWIRRNPLHFTLVCTIISIISFVGVYVWWDDFNHEVKTIVSTDSINHSLSKYDTLYINVGQKGDDNYYIIKQTLCPHKEKTYTISGKEAYVICLSMVTLAIAIVAFIAQKQTEENTAKVTPELQFDIMVDLMRHLYRNFEVITAAYMCMEKNKNTAGQYTHYPAEEHIFKLQIPLENIHLEAFINENKKGNKGIYDEVNELYLQIRNHNEEVKVICKHLKDPTLAYATKEEDFRILLSRTAHLTKQFQKVIGEGVGVYGFNDFVEKVRKRITQTIASDGDKGNSPRTISSRYGLDILNFDAEYANFVNTHLKISATSINLHLFDEIKYGKNADVPFVDILKVSVEKRCFVYKPGQTIRLIPLP